jgi:hypothetical protein
MTIVAGMTSSDLSNPNLQRGSKKWRATHDSALLFVFPRRTLKSRVCVRTIFAALPLLVAWVGRWTVHSQVGLCHYEPAIARPLTDHQSGFEITKPTPASPGRALFRSGRSMTRPSTEARVVLVSAPWFRSLLWHPYLKLASQPMASQRCPSLSGLAFQKPSHAAICVRKLHVLEWRVGSMPIELIR